MKYHLEKEIENIIEENKGRLTISMIMELIDELSDFMCEELAEELNISFEELEPKFKTARNRLEKILKEDTE